MLYFLIVSIILASDIFISYLVSSSYQAAIKIYNQNIENSFIILNNKLEILFTQQKTILQNNDNLEQKLLEYNNSVQSLKFDPKIILQEISELKNKDFNKIDKEQFQEILSSIKYESAEIKNNITAHAKTNIETNIETDEPMEIHFIWIGGQPIPDKYMDNFNICQRLNPQSTCRIWTNDQCLALLEETNLMEYWSTLSFICKYNLLKYLILDKFGGIYSDLDITWKTSFSKILNDMEFNHFHAIFTVVDSYTPINVGSIVVDLVDDPFIVCRKGILGKCIEYCQTRTKLKHDGELYMKTNILQPHKSEPVGPFGLTEWLYTKSNIKFNLMAQMDLLNGRCLYGNHEQKGEWNKYV
jgi:hypothetical protein